MIVGSLAVSFVVLTSPPPETVTVLVRGLVADAATLTVTVMIGYVELPARTSLRVHVSVPRTQVHPVPAIWVAVSPAGRLSVTVTVPLVGLRPAFLATI